MGGRLRAASVVFALALVAAAPTEAGTSLKGWRDGPVSDLLTEDEYRQFGALRTDAARRTFIDGFWRGLETVSRQIQLRRREHAVRMDVDTQFLVPQFDLRRRQPRAPQPRRHHHQCGERRTEPQPAARRLLFHP